MKNGFVCGVAYVFNHWFSSWKWLDDLDFYVVVMMLGLDFDFDFDFDVGFVVCVCVWDECVCVCVYGDVELTTWYAEEEGTERLDPELPRALKAVVYPYNNELPMQTYNKRYH